MLSPNSHVNAATHHFRDIGFLEAPNYDFWDPWGYRPQKGEDTSDNRLYRRRHMCPHTKRQGYSNLHIPQNAY